MSMDSGLVFDRAAGERACMFFEKFLRHWQGQAAGQPFRLAPWQREGIVMPLFGWKRADGTRRFRTAHIEVPRKQGKSTMAAGFALLLLVADGEPGASVVSAAADKEQAREVFRCATQMVAQSPELQAYLTVYRNSIAFKSKGACYQVISADAHTKHGRNDSGVVIDELHAQPNSDLYSVLTSGVMARRQPLTIQITTAGNDMHGLCREQHEYGRKVLSGEIVDDSFFAFFRGADDTDTWYTLETMIKANPGLGLDDWLVCADPQKHKHQITGPVSLRPDIQQEIFGGQPPGDLAGYVDRLTQWSRRNPGIGESVRLDALLVTLTRAVNSPMAEAQYNWLHLNRWMRSEARWLKIEQWDQCCDPDLDIDALASRPCYGGLDLATRRDINAFVLAWPPAPGWAGPYADKWVLAQWFWVPHETAAEREKEARVPYGEWHKAGELLYTDGAAADQDRILSDILDVCKRFDVQQIGYDQWSAHRIVTKMTAIGFVMVEIPQIPKHLSEPSKLLEAALVSNQVVHDANRVMRWMAGNVIVTSDVNENIRPDKRKSSEKIDGIVAAIMAVERGMKSDGNNGRSQYEGDVEPLIV